ncbi:MAG TPA: hypothetical protein VMY43_03390 [Methanothrix sp.]|nr:hypothetical protein [Methanothrix sp.]
MNALAGWDGPDCIADGVFRYSKYISWIRLYIDVEGSELYGGTCGACTNFEVECEDGRWMRFETSPAWTESGEPVMRLRGYSTWDVVYERTSEGTPFDEKIETVEDLAAFLERCFSP